MARNTAVDFRLCRDCHCLAARRHARAVTRVYDGKLRPYGLRSTQFSVLAALAAKGSTRLTVLADFLGLERTTLTRIAALLDRDGLMNDDPAGNGRERLLSVTEAGRRRLERAFPAWQQAQDHISRGMAAAASPAAHLPAPEEQTHEHDDHDPDRRDGPAGGARPRRRRHAPRPRARA